ncbi:MAG: class I SAM-dependent methyltransferase [Planctomycetaceae bacterium]|nr:class I SAM-dependent methyltransferase [Planctomycetaceae bacterium]
MSGRTRDCSDTLEPEMTPAEQAFLRDLIRRENFSGTHLEIGTAAGGSLCSMMSCFHDDARPRFVVVDRMNYFPRQKDIVCQNLEQHGLSPAAVDFRESSSATAFHAAAAQQERFDFMLIDACHKILAVMADLRWMRLLNVGGIACFHDYATKFPGVKLSVDRLLARYNNYEIVGQADSLLAIRKTAICRSGEISLADNAYGMAMVIPLTIERKLKKWNLRKSA